jgi:hypothetical protein
MIDIILPDVANMVNPIILTNPSRRAAFVIEGDA